MGSKGITCKNMIYCGNRWIGLSRSPCKLKLVRLLGYVSFKNWRNLGFFLIALSSAAIAVVKLLT